MARNDDKGRKSDRADTTTSSSSSTSSGGTRSPSGSSGRSPSTSSKDYGVQRSEISTGRDTPNGVFQTTSRGTAQSLVSENNGSTQRSAPVDPAQQVPALPGQVPDPVKEVRNQRMASSRGVATRDAFTGKAVLPRTNKVDASKRPHCKPRPKDNRPTGGGGGGRKKFAPWCG